MSDKKPDMVVFNEDENRYDAALKPYATGVGAPKIEMTNIAPWKQTSINSFNKKANAKFAELQEAYNELVESMEYNALVLKAKFSFQPIIGKHYHLYTNKKDESFLSLVAPNECNWNHLGSFRLNSDNIWERI